VDQRPELHADRLGRPPAGLGHYLRDIVYGASDGVITTLAVIAGAAGAAFDRKVGFVLALANLAADGLSMGASNYLGLRSELEQTGESVRAEKPWRHGSATFLAFVVAGSSPLLAFLSPAPSGLELYLLALLPAILTLALVGGARARFVHKPVTRAALEVVIVALAAATSAFLIGLGARWLSARL